MRISKLVCGLASATLLTCTATIVSASESVGTLARINGTVLVNQGEQYVNGREGLALRPGDRIMAMDSGSALIQFADGCKYDLADNAVLTISEKSTCSSDTVATREVGPYYAQVGNGNQEDDDDYTDLWIFGGATLGLGLLVNDGDDGISK